LGLDIPSFKGQWMVDMVEFCRLWKIPSKSSLAESAYLRDSDRYSGDVVTSCGSLEDDWTHGVPHTKRMVQPKTRESSSQCQSARDAFLPDQCSGATAARR
jgi:hypothetical protein